MPYTVREFQETPNPNAIKCVLDRRASERSRSFFNAEQAAADPLGAALFAIPGVTNVLIHSDWITVNKAPDRPWSALKPAITRVLRDAS